MSLTSDQYKWFSTDCHSSQRIFEEKGYLLNSRRNDFQRDRDRIIASTAFFRLDGKTQVFYADSKDHVRNRLTHSLGVLSIADSIARQLYLNTDLIEAIALGHDLGHTPYGHIGERTLNHVMNGCEDIMFINSDLKEGQRGFKHNYQGYREVTRLSHHDRNHLGLNLTKHTLWGIVNHTGLEYNECDEPCLSPSKIRNLQNNNGLYACEKKRHIDFYKSDDDLAGICSGKYIPFDSSYWSPEAIVVSVADEIDQRIHDIADAVEMGIADLPEIANEFKELMHVFMSKEHLHEYDGMFTNGSFSKENDYATSYGLSRFSRLLADVYIDNFIEHYKTTMLCYIKEHKVINKDSYIISRASNVPLKKGFSADFEKSDKNLSDYLKNLILQSHRVQLADGRASLIIRRLFKALVSNPKQLPDKTLFRLAVNLAKLNLEAINKLFGDSPNKKIIKNIKDELIKQYLFHDWKSDNENYVILLRTICDFIAGMTDQFADSYYHELYGIKDISLDFR